MGNNGAVLVVSVLAATVLGTALDVQGFFAGVDRQKDREQGGMNLEAGCTCHTMDAVPDVQAALQGVPFNFTRPADGSALTSEGDYAPRSFLLNVSVEGGPAAAASGAQGGFNLWASAGNLTPSDDTTQILHPRSNEVTHTASGNGQRNWTVNWTAPSDPGDSVVFILTANSVDGSGTPGPEDHWARLVLVSQGFTGKLPGTAEEEHRRIEELGVNWYAYWVGVVAFAVLVVVLVAYYFVLKYSETTHATDERSRKDAKK